VNWHEAQLSHLIEWSNDFLVVEVEVTLRLTVSWPVSLGVRPPSGTHDQFFFLLDIFFRHLWVCYFVAPSLTRGRVCNLLFAAGPRQHSHLLSTLSDKRSGLSSLLSDDCSIQDTACIGTESFDEDTKDNFLSFVYEC
jgi:hypothetical protein